MNDVKGRGGSCGLHQPLAASANRLPGILNLFSDAVTSSRAEFSSSELNLYSVLSKYKDSHPFYCTCTCTSDNDFTP